MKAMLILVGSLVVSPLIAQETTTGTTPNPWLAVGDEATATSIIISTNGRVVIERDGKGVSDVSVTFDGSEPSSSKKYTTRPAYRLHTNGTVRPTREGEVIKIAVLAPSTSGKGTECQMNHQGNGCIHSCPYPGSCTYHHDSQNNYCDCQKK